MGKEEDAMEQRNDNRMIRWLALAAALLFGCLFLIIGVTWARYQENQSGELNYTTKETLALSLWRGMDASGDLILGENTWEKESGMATLDFYIGNGGSEDNAALETQEVRVRLMVGPGMYADEATELTLWIEDEDGNGEYLNGELKEIPEGTPLYENFGSGWYYAFCDTDGEEMTWTLEGGRLSVLKAQLLLKEAGWTETTLLQLLVESDHHNRAMWNTLLQPARGVNSDVLVPDYEEQVVLLGELTEENIEEKEFLWMYFQSDIEEVGHLNYDFVDSTQEKYLDVTILDQDVYLSEITTYSGVRLGLTKAAREVTEDVTVDFEVSLTTESRVLTSIFRLMLPAAAGTADDEKLAEILDEAVPLTDVTSSGAMEESISGGAISPAKTKGKLKLSAMEDYYIDALIPVMIDIPEDANIVTVSLYESGESAKFPRLTRYSEDDGETWKLLYFSDVILTHRDFMIQTTGGCCLILDLSRTVDVADDEKDETAAEVDETTFLRIHVECETPTQELSGRVTTRPNAMTFNTSTSQTPMLLELDGTLLFPLVESWADAAQDGVILEKRVPSDDEPNGYGYEMIDLDQGMIHVTLNNEALLVQAGEGYLEAGTYRLTIYYRFCDIQFAETQITFFVNYSDGALLGIQGE